MRQESAQETGTVSDQFGISHGNRAGRVEGSVRTLNPSDREEHGGWR